VEKAVFAVFKYYRTYEVPVTVGSPEFMKPLYHEENDVSILLAVT